MFMRVRTSIFDIRKFCKNDVGTFQRNLRLTFLMTRRTITDGGVLNFVTNSLISYKQLQRKRFPKATLLVFRVEFKTVINLKNMSSLWNFH